jgi:clan AA aspartic protease (TIGR02281 family)
MVAYFLKQDEKGIELKMIRYLNVFVWGLLIIVWPALLRADGRYQILRDDDGVYFQTENEGGWYIPEEHQYLFPSGKAGWYRIGRDEVGRYLLTEQGKFYLGNLDEEEFNSNPGDTPSAINQQPFPQSDETEVVLVGQQVLVPVKIKHKGRKLLVHLLLDTGASIITLHKASVKRLRLGRSQSARFNTASGQSIEADLVRLEEVRFGPYRKADILAGVIEHQQGAKAGYDGLLGMNALQGLRYEIDYDKGAIRWMN